MMILMFLIINQVHELQSYTVKEKTRFDNRNL
jgi:hypothetical protein